MKKATRMEPPEGKVPENALQNVDRNTRRIWSPEDNKHYDLPKLGSLLVARNNYEGCGPFIFLGVRFVESGMGITGLDEKGELTKTCVELVLFNEEAAKFDAYVECREFNGMPLVYPPVRALEPDPRLLERDEGWWLEVPQENDGRDDVG